MPEEKKDLDWCDEGRIPASYYHLMTTVFDTVVYGARPFVIAGPNFREVHCLLKAGKRMELVPAARAMAWLTAAGMNESSAGSLLRSAVASPV